MLLPRRRYHRWLALLLVAALLVGCRPAWQTAVIGPGGEVVPVDRGALAHLQAFTEEVQGRKLLPLERVLAGAGYTVVEAITITAPDGAQQRFGWPEVASQAWWLENGRLRIGGQELAVAQLEAEPSPLAAEAQVRITDVAPTIAASLGLAAPAKATGQALEAPKAAQAALILLDGLGYARYTEAVEDGLIPHLAALGTPLTGLTVYPPVTSVASAALITGAPPEVNGAYQRGIRKTDVETLFDVVAAAGRRAVAVEGESLPFNLRNAEVKLSGDRNGNGATDDEVLANTLAVLSTGMPDLLYVHFHGIDDTGHTYGPGAPEEEALIREVDFAVGELLEALPSDTLVVIVADHGMHHVQEEGRLGNHGHLIDRDMLIPILLLHKD